MGLICSCYKYRPYHVQDPVIYSLVAAFFCHILMVCKWFYKFRQLLSLLPLESRTVIFKLSFPSISYMDHFYWKCILSSEPMSQRHPTWFEPMGDTLAAGDHYGKLSRAMWAPLVDRFLNNEIYCYPLSKKRCGPPVSIPSDRLAGGDRKLRPAAT